MAAGETIEQIRALARKRRFPASYTYVTDEESRLIGVLNMRDLMLASPEQSLGSFMIKDVYAFHCFIDRADVAEELAKRKFFAAPVVDGENRIVGIVKAERMIDGAREEASKDMQRMCSDFLRFSDLPCCFKTIWFECLKGGFVREKGRLVGTPLFLVLLAIESSDIMFAVDSVPAILAISTDPFIVYTSNAFAILGLRALYFALESLMRSFSYLKHGLSLILVIVGIKMLISNIVKIPALIILPVVFGILAGSILLSLRKAKSETNGKVDTVSPK